MYTYVSADSALPVRAFLGEYHDSLHSEVSTDRWGHLSNSQTAKTTKTTICFEARRPRGKSTHSKELRTSRRHNTQTNCCLLLLLSPGNDGADEIFFAPQSPTAYTGGIVPFLQTENYHGYLEPARSEALHDPASARTADGHRSATGGHHPERQRQGDADHAVCVGALARAGQRGGAEVSRQRADAAAGVCPAVRQRQERLLR